MGNNLFIITGPSGVGKTTVAHELLKQNPKLKKLITYTTRHPRPNEKNDRDYHFITPEQFEKKIQTNDFFEYAQVYNDYYGNSFSDLKLFWDQGYDVLMVVDIQGADKIKSTIPQSKVIFLCPENFSQLEKRLQERKMTKNDYEKRIQTAENEMKRANQYDFQIINQENQLPQTLHKIQEIIG